MVDEFRRSESGMAGSEVVMTGVADRGLGLLGPVVVFPSSAILAVATGLVVPSSTVARLPRQRLVFGGRGFTFCFVGLDCLSGWCPSWRLGVMIPGFSRWDATSCTLREDVEAGSRCIPSLATWLCLRGVSLADAGESRSSARGNDKSSSELPRVLADSMDWEDSRDVPISASDRRALSIVGKEEVKLSSLCGTLPGLYASSSPRSQSTVAHRRTNRRVVSSTSSKCVIFSQSAAVLPVSWPRTRRLSIRLSSSRL